MSNILTRTIWGALFVAIILSSFFVGGYAAAVVLAIFMLIGLAEFYRFFDKIEDVNPAKTIGLIGGFLLFLGMICPELMDYDLNFYLLFIPLTFLPLLYIVYSKTKNPLLDIAVTLFSWIYILLPFYFMFKIYAFEYGNQDQWVLIIGFFIMVWANDTFAYLSGRFFGKHKLFERISPKKTWEGAIGGFIFTIIFGLIYSFITNNEYTFWIVSAIIVSPTSVFGDLIESRFKRIVNVKDSGTIVPGHGGVLDRFDAAMYAAPFFYMLVTLFFS